MPITSTNLIRPVVSGLDNLPINNSMLEAGGMLGYSTPSSISQISNPASIGISNIFINSTINKSTQKANQMADDIQSLANSVGNQEARIAAGTGTNIAEQYLEDEEKKDEGLLTKIFNILDAPRNALFNGFKYAFSGYDGGFFEGFWSGLTREEEYTGYDLMEDMGLEEGSAGNIIGGFLAEVFLDPVNWIDWGVSSLVKGFAQGAVKSTAKEVLDNTVRHGVRELGEQAIKEGAEEVGQSIISSGIRNLSKQTVKESSEEISEQVAKASIKNNIDTGLGGIFNRLNKKLTQIEDAYGLTYGNAKLQALWSMSYKEARETTRLAGGLTDDVLAFAAKGNYGTEVQQLAQEFITNKQTLAGVDDALREGLEQTVKQQKDELLDLLKDYRIDVRLDALSMKNINIDDLRQGVSDMYESTAVGALKSLEKENNVDNVVDLMNALSIKTGKEITERDIYLEMIRRGFGERTLAPLTQQMLDTASVEVLRDNIIENLIDVVAADKLYEKGLQKGIRQLGTGFGFSVPFTNVKKEMQSATDMFELGAKLRTLVSYKINPAGELVPTLTGDMLRKVGGSVSALFGHLPILGNALSETNRLDKANRWALKLIQQSTKGKAQLAASVAENSIENYYKILKEAGFSEPEELTDVGNFISTAIESRQLTKTDTVDDWLRQISSYTSLDDATIESQVSTRLAELERQFQAGEIEDMFTTGGSGTIDPDKFAEFYKQTETSLRNELTSKSQLKDLLMSYDEKKQRAMLEVTKLMAEDFDGIGKQLVDLHLIPDERMLQPEYWYFPHKMNLDLMLQDDMNYDRVLNRVDGLARTTAEAEEDAKEGFTRGMRNVIGGRTERFTLRNVSSWQRKYPMSTVEVNKILKQKYGIDHMLETNAFNTYLLYAIDEGKVIADSGEIDDILNTFATKVNNKEMIPMLRGRGYTIVTRRTNVDAIQVSPKAMEGVTNYDKIAKDFNDKLKKVKSARKSYEQVQRRAGRTIEDMTKQIDTANQSREILKEMQKSNKEVIKKSKDIVTDVDYLQDLVNKGVFPNGVDIETIEEMLDSTVNNEFLTGSYITKTDSIGSQAIPSIMSKSAFRNQDGMPQIFMSNSDTAATGFRLVPQAVDNIPNEDFFYLSAKKPIDIQVDDISTELANAANKYSDQLKQTYMSQGYDSIRLIDPTGAVAVIPFEDADVIYKNKLKQIEYSSKFKYAEDMANTTDGSFINPKSVFVPDDTVINIKDIPTRRRKALSKLLDSDYQTTRATINELNRQKDYLLGKTTEVVYNGLPKHMQNYIDINYGGDIDILKLMNRRDEIMNTFKGKELPTNYAREISMIDNITDAKSGATSVELANLKEIDKRLNNINTDRKYNFIAGLKKAKGFDSEADAYITTQELYDMLGSNREAGLVSLGYDAILDTTTSSGKNIYKALPNAEKITKQELMDGYEAVMTMISVNDEAADMVKLLTDVGTGRDALANIVNKYANKKGIDNMTAMRNRLQRIMDTDTTKLDDLAQLPYAKQYTEKQKNLIARLSSETGILSTLEGDAAEDMFDIQNTMTLLTKEDTDIWAIPQEIVNYLNKATKKQTDDGIKLLKEAMWKFNKIWKPSVTAWRPSFGVRNLMSGYFNSTMYAGARIFDPDVTSSAIKMVTGRDLDAVVNYGGTEYTLKQLKDAMTERNVHSGLVNTDINGIGEALARQLKKATDPSEGSILRHPLKAMEKLNASVEDYNRSLLFLAAVKNGETLDYAADIVKHLQFDYGDLSEFEKTIKKVMPFYTWIRNNIPLQIERFMDSPRLYTLLMKRVPEMSKEASGMSDEEWDNMPDWVKDTFPIVLGKDPSTGRYRLFDTTLPYQDLSKIGNVKEMFGEAVSLLHPLIKTPAELFLNKNLYTGAALESYEGETAEQAIKGTANPILNAIAKVAPNALRSMPRCYCCS